ncbi:reverse transcriptase domain-containing protein [Tanacetum coccineum]
MCGRMFHEESDEVEKVKGTDVASYTLRFQPKTMEKSIEFANDQMDQKNTRRAYTAGPGEKRKYTRSLPLCTKCNYHHKGPCAPRCNKCKKIRHLARDYRSSGPNVNNNNRGNFGMTQNAGTCYECSVQGHFKRDCP